MYSITSSLEESILFYLEFNSKEQASSFFSTTAYPYQLFQDQALGEVSIHVDTSEYLLGSSNNFHQTNSLL